MAQAIGWQPAALIEQKLRNFLAENGLCVYPYEKVESYLDSIFGPCTANYAHFTTWGWRPLRKCDMGWNHELFHAQRNGSTLESECYPGAVPFPVLLTVRKIAEAFPEVRFFVSDKPNRIDFPREDPFLGVGIPGIKLPLVVERWDEPSFRM